MQGSALRTVTGVRDRRQGIADPAAGAASLAPAPAWIVEPEHLLAGKAGQHPSWLSACCGARPAPGIDGRLHPVPTAPDAQHARLLSNPERSAGMERAIKMHRGGAGHDAKPRWRNRGQRPEFQYW